MKRAFGCLVPLLLAVAACESTPDSPLDGGVAEAGVMPAGAATCADNWRVVLAQQPSEAPNTVRWHAGKLYFASGAGRKLQSMPEAGGTPTVMTDDAVEALWIEGDRLFFASWGGRLFGIPVAGGTPVLVLDGGIAGAEGVPAFFRTHALDATHYYWTHGRQTDHGVWRVARGGGNAQKLLAVPDEGAVEALTYTPDTLIVSLPERSLALPKTGGVPRALSQSGPFLGAASDGVLWVQGGPKRRQLMLSPLSGQEAAPFWPTMPPDLVPGRAWPDLDGGWMIAATETFSDGEHLSIWRVDRNQQGARIGCDGAANGRLADDQAQAAITTDAVYVPVSHPLGMDLQFEWSMVKVSR